MKHELTRLLISVTKYFVCTTLFFIAAVAIAFTVPEKPTAYVSDFAGVVSSESLVEITAQLENLDANVAEIAVVTIPSLDGEPIEQLANEIFRKWGIGLSDVDNGVLFLISPSDRQMRIEVGYGLEGALTDLETYRIQEDVVKPYFKEGDYSRGIVEGVNSIILAIKEDTPQSSLSDSSFFGKENIFSVLNPFTFFFVIFGFQILFSVLAPTKSWWLGGILGGALGVAVGMVLASVLAGIIGVLVLVVLGLLFDYTVSKTYRARGKGRRDFWTTGGFGGSSGGSSGGFSGFGGGSSGGGGSSSNW